MNMNNRAARFGMKTAFSYIGKDPDKNLPKLMKWVDMFAGDGTNSFEEQRNAFRKVIDDPENNMHKLLWSIWEDIDEDVLKTIFENFLINGNIVGWPISRELQKNITVIFRGQYCSTQRRRVICTAKVVGRQSTEISLI